MIKKRLFYTQGDFGLFQSEDGKDGITFDNEVWVNRAMEAQGFIRDDSGEFDVPSDKSIKMQIPSELIPVMPTTGGPVTNNLRADGTFRRRWWLARCFGKIFGFPAQTREHECAIS